MRVCGLSVGFSSEKTVDRRLQINNINSNADEQQVFPSLFVFDTYAVSIHSKEVSVAENWLSEVLNACNSRFAVLEVQYY